MDDEIRTRLLSWHILGSAAEFAWMA